MSQAQISPIGMTGRLTIGTRGDDGPGEAEFQIRGGTETFIARSSRTLLEGQQIVCVDVIGPRTVLVEPWGELVDSMLRL